MSFDTWWIALIAWTVTGLLIAIAFGRVARSNEDTEHDAVLDAGMPVSSTPNVSHFRRQKRTAAAAAASATQQAARNEARRRVSR